MRIEIATWTETNLYLFWYNWKHFNVKWKLQCLPFITNSLMTNFT